MAVSIMDMCLTSCEPMVWRMNVGPGCVLAGRILAVVCMRGWVRMLCAGCSSMACELRALFVVLLCLALLCFVHLLQIWLWLAMCMLMHAHFGAAWAGAGLWEGHHREHQAYNGGCGMWVGCWCVDKSGPCGLYYLHAASGGISYQGGGMCMDYTGWCALPTRKSGGCRYEGSRGLQLLVSGFAAGICCYRPLVPPPLVTLTKPNQTKFASWP